MVGKKFMNVCTSYHTLSTLGGGLESFNIFLNWIIPNSTSLDYKFIYICVCVFVCERLCVCVRLPKPLHVQDITQGQFLSRVEQVLSKQD